ncbi:MAG: MFS transporter [Fimbriiglobus sp.]
MTDTPATPAAAPGPDLDDRARKRAMLVVFLVVAIDLLGFGIVLPLVPRLTDTLLGGYSENAQGFVIGAIYSSFSLMQFVFAPVLGRVSDRVGRRPVLLFALLGSVVFYALFGYAATLTGTPELAVGLLLAARIGAGIAGASVSTAAAVIADCTTPEKRAKGMALIGAAFGIGFTFGPLIAWAGDSVFQNAAWGPGAMASAISGVAFLLAVGLMPETLKPGPKPPREFFSVGRTLAVLRTPAVGPLVLIFFLAIFGFANFEATLSLFTASAFRMSVDDNYLVFAYVGFVLMIAQGGVYRPLAGRRSEQYLMSLGVGLMLIGLGVLVLVAYATFTLNPPTEDGIEIRVTADAALGLKPMFYLGVTVAVFGFAFVNPSISSLVSRRADPARQGEVLGVNQAFAALGRILGPVVGAVAFKAHPSRVLPFAIAAGLLMCVVALLPQANDDADGAAKTDRG